MKRILIIFFLIMIIITFFQITNMYALYKTELEESYQSKLGKWNLAINSEDITSSEFVQFENKLMLQSVDSEIIETDKVAPGSKFYIELNIDPKDTDVSIIYEFNIDDICSSIDEKIKEKIGLEELKWNIKIDDVESVFKKEEEEDISQENELHAFSDEKYMGVFPLDKINDGYINCVKIYFKWINEEDKNDIDNIIGQHVIKEENEENIDERELNEVSDEENIFYNNSFSINASIIFKQYIGESIEISEE